MLRGQTCYEHEIAFGWFKRPLLALSGLTHMLMSALSEKQTCKH